LQIEVKRLHPDTILPKYALSDDAGMDLFSLAEYTIGPGELCRVETGVALNIPSGYAGLIWDKGGMSLKMIKTVGGVFDAGYQGDLTIGLVNLGKVSYTIEKGSKVAQILIQKVEHPELVEVKDFPPSERGVSRYGSTGEK